MSLSFFHVFWRRSTCNVCCCLLLSLFSSTLVLYELYIFAFHYKLSILYFFRHPIVRCHTWTGCTVIWFGSRSSLLRSTCSVIQLLFRNNVCLCELKDVVVWFLFKCIGMSFKNLCPFSPSVNYSIDLDACDSELYICLFHFCVDVVVVVVLFDVCIVWIIHCCISL